MEWKDLAPWIAIAITLGLSILVPLFTQIANNRHQRKMQKEKFEYEQKQKKIVVYENFLLNVGAVIACNTVENRTLAGSSIQQMYLYAPKEWWIDLDFLFDELRNAQYSKASMRLGSLNKLISKELNK